MKNLKTVLAFGFVLMFAVVFALVPVAPAFSSESKDTSPAEATTMPQDGDGWQLVARQFMQVPCGENIFVCGSVLAYARTTNETQELKMTVNFNGYGCVTVFYVDSSDTTWQ